MRARECSFALVEWLNVQVPNAIDQYEKVFNNLLAFTALTKRIGFGTQISLKDGVTIDSVVERALEELRSLGSDAERLSVKTLLSGAGTDALAAYYLGFSYAALEES